MNLIVVGLNHETAPLEVREKAMLDESSQQNFLQGLTHQSSIQEAASLFTCNRTEVYFLGQCSACFKAGAHDLNCTQQADHCLAGNEGISTVFNSLKRYSHSKQDDFSPFLYQHTGLNMVKHLMRVASGLNSMILGEPQILGQVKASYRIGVAAGSIKRIFSRLFEHTFHTAKTVRTQTAIGVNPVSIPFVVMTLSKQFFETLENKRVLMIGAGKVIQLCSRHLHQNQAKNIHFSNRTLSKAEALAEEFNGRAIALAEISHQLHRFDLIISSTASADLIIQPQHLQQLQAIRNNQRTLLIDLAVPRDIAQPNQHQKSLYYYDVDHLSSIIDQSKLKRSTAIGEAQNIIDYYSQDFSNWLDLQTHQPRLLALFQFADNLSRQAKHKAFKQLQQGTAAEVVIEQLSEQLKKQLIHPSVQGLRQAIKHQNLDRIQHFDELFQLTGNNTKDHPNSSKRLS